MGAQASVFKVRIAITYNAMGPMKGKKVMNVRTSSPAKKAKTATKGTRAMKVMKAMKASKAKVAPKLKLTYLNHTGKAEPIRLALFIGGLEFEDCRVDYAGVKALRETGESPWDQVPVLQI